MPAIVRKVYGDSRYYAAGDIDAAAMNMCHRAMDLGLATCILGLVDQKKMEQHFGIPEGQVVRLVLAVGYSAEEEPVPEKRRKDVEEVCSFNHW